MSIAALNRHTRADSPPSISISQGKTVEKPKTQMFCISKDYKLTQALGFTTK